MGFTVTETNMQQSAVKAAAEITAAMTTAGLLTSAESVDETFDRITGRIFDGLKTISDKEIAEAPAAAPRGGTAASSKNPGDKIVPFGKFKGQTIAQVYAQDSKYVTEYLSEKAQLNDIKAAAKAFAANPTTSDSPGYLGN